MFVLGACIGSFLCCQVRRLHLKEKKQKFGPRSICLHCKKQLKWYENIPIISWLALGGKCSKCKTKIGAAEIVSELLVAIAFLCVGTTIDIVSATAQNWVVFATTLLLVSSLCFLGIYDGIYGELPNFALVISIILAIAVFLSKNWLSFSWAAVLDALFAIAILGGIYLFLYLISKGKWVGDGDWILGVIIGLALGSPWLALITLFVSNITACFVMYPAVKSKKNKQIFFGPFLVMAFIIAVTFSGFLESVIIY